MSGVCESSILKCNSCYKKKEMDFIDRLNELGVISFKTLLIIRKKELQKDMIKINTKNIKMATN